MEDMVESSLNFLKGKESENGTMEILKRWWLRNFLLIKDNNPRFWKTNPKQHLKNTLIPKPDKNIKRKLHKNSLFKTNIKILNIILANQIQQYIKRIINHDQWSLSQESKVGLAFKICQYNPHINRLKKKYQIIISVNTEKPVDKIQHLLLI